MSEARYKRKNMPNHPRSSTYGCVRKHVLVAEEILGRYLIDKEVVHHKDGNRFNNTKENIMVFKTDSDHSKYHKGGTPILLEDGTYSCSSAKKDYYCSCGNKLSRKTNNKCVECYRKDTYAKLPSNDELKKLLWEIPTCEILKIHKVSHKFIEKFCRDNGIKKPPRGYWQKKKVGKV